MSTSTSYGAPPRETPEAFRNLHGAALRAVWLAEDLAAFGSKRDGFDFDGWPDLVERARDVVRLALGRQPVIFPPEPLPPIVVSVAGGLVQDIEQVPPGLVVEVRNYDLDEARIPCPACDGAGETYVTVSASGDEGATHGEPVPCTACAGTGEDPAEYDRDPSGGECSIARWGGA